MAGADEMPNGLTGCYNPNKILRQYIESPLLSGMSSFPRYAVIKISFYGVKTCPLLVLPEKGLYLITWGEVANQVSWL